MAVVHSYPRTHQTEGNCFMVEQYEEARNACQPPYCPSDCTDCELPAGWYRVRSALTRKDAWALSTQYRNTRVVPCDKCADL